MIEELPLVSVWMITYNHENLIRQSLDSIIRQKADFNFEIIIGEDYSTDLTQDIIKNYFQKYPHIIKPIFHEQNIGMIANMAMTLKSCRGKYIAMCEGDDHWIDEYKLQKQVSLLESDENIGLVYTNYKKTHRSNFVIENFYGDKKMPEGYVLADIIKGEFPYALTVCFRSSLLQNDFYEYFIDPKFRMGDYPLWLYLSSKTKFKYLDDITAAYEFNSESITNSLRGDLAKIIDFTESWIYIQQKFIEKFNINDLEVLKRSKNSILQKKISLIDLYLYSGIKGRIDKIINELKEANTRIPIKQAFLIFISKYLPFGNLLIRTYFRIRQAVYYIG